MKTIIHDGMTFRLQTEYDHSVGPPHKCEDGHGEVREARRLYSNWPEKKPGELVLRNGGARDRDILYDFAGACKIALRDGWGTKADSAGMTRRQVAAMAAREDYDRLRGWYENEWDYVGVVVTLLDLEGNETPCSESLWGIESDADDEIEKMAAELAEQCADGAGIIDGVYTCGARTWRVKA